MRHRVLFVACLLIATPLRAFAAPCGVSVSLPNRGGDVVGSSLSIAATVSSVCQLQTVVATAPGQNVALTFDAVSRTWVGTMPMSTVPFGTFTLTVTGTDIFGTAGSSSVSLVHDEPPTLTITAPEPYTLGRPSLHISVSCHDDDPAHACWMKVLFGVSFPDTLATGYSSIDQDVVIPGSGGVLNFAVFDSRGQVHIESRYVYAESSPRLVEVSQAPGLVLDDSPSQSLFGDASGQVCLFDKATSTTTVLLGGQSYQTFAAHLTAFGAVFAAQPLPSGALHAYEWRSGTLLDLGTPDTWLTVNASSAYMTWLGKSSTSSTHALYLRDIAAGSTVMVDAQATANGGAAPNGDVVYPGASSQLWRYRGGVTTAISAPKPGISDPVSDGTNVAYQLKSSQSYSTWLITPGGEIALDAAGTGSAASGSDYAVDNGWTAFTRSASDGSRNVWERAPDGTTSRVTFFGDIVSIAALNSDGRVVVYSGGRTYLTGPNAAVVDVGASWSPAFWRGSDVFLVIGRSVMRVLQTLPIGTYTPDVDGDGRTDMLRFAAGGWQIKTSSTTFSTPAAVTLGADGDVPVIGDFDGDGRQDPAVYRASSGMWTIANSGSLAGPPVTLHLGGPSFVAVAGDYDADGKTDPAVYDRTSGTWLVVTSSSNYATTLTFNWGGPGFTAVGNLDFDGDGKTDLTVYQPATGRWFVALSGSGYSSTLTVTLGGPGIALVPGDYDGDRKADFAVYERATGLWHELRSSTGYTTQVDVAWGGAGYIPVPGDYDGDTRFDPAVFLPATGTWYVLKSSSDFTSSFAIDWSNGTGAPVSSAVFPATPDQSVTDVDGDAASDLTVYNPASGYWYTLTSAQNFAAATNIRWGGSGYAAVAGDFDGDGRADRAVYEPSTGWWFVLLSSTGFSTSQARNLGGPGWTPVPADYDGDGKTDFVVYNAATGQWYGLLSGGGYTTTLNVMLGGSGFTAVPADFDGDGRADVAVYEVGTGVWTVRTAASNFTLGFTRGVGGTGWAPVPADFDGDGKADFVVYNTTTGIWYGLKSSTNYMTTLNVGWGGTGLVPIKADVDGDGRADLAVYEPTSGAWYVLLSGANYSTAMSRSWGGPGYLAVSQFQQ
jgi:hypothetical protein